MKQLLNFIFSDQTLEIDFDRTPYKTISKAVGGQNNFIDSACDTILPEIKVLQGKLITVQEYVPIFNLRQQSVYMY
jgi:hypothetical protein